MRHSDNENKKVDSLKAGATIIYLIEIPSHVQIIFLIRRFNCVSLSQRKSLTASFYTWTDVFKIVKSRQN